MSHYKKYSLVITVIETNNYVEQCIYCTLYSISFEKYFFYKNLFSNRTLKHTVCMVHYNKYSLVIIVIETNNYVEQCIYYSLVEEFIIETNLFYSELIKFQYLKITPNSG